MGYSRSKETVKNNKEYLDILLKFKDESEFRLPTNQPTKLAGKLREALSIVAEHPKSFPEYSELVGKFTYKVEQAAIRVTKRFNLVTGNPERITPEGLGVAQSLEVPDCKTAIQVVGAAIKHKADTMTFPNCRLGSDSLMDLYKWTSKNGYHFFIDPVLTLTRTETDEAWEPPA